MDLEEALTRLATRINVIEGVELIDTNQAVGRILAADVQAPISLPPFPASAMDGYAVRHQDFVGGNLTFTLIGESKAGHPSDATVQERQAVRIFTGARMPNGADLVPLQERVTSSHSDTVTFSAHESDESFVRPVGHDIRRDQVIAHVGGRLHPFLVGSLNAAGVAQVRVRRMPVVGLFSSGDELTDINVPPEHLGPGDIYDSNRATLRALLAGLPVAIRDLGCIADDPDAVEQALAQGASECDVMITSGGVSVGDADFVGQTIDRIGELEFWRLNLKPGKPLAFGHINGCWIFGLPGNPVSTIVTALLVVIPSLLTLAGGNPSRPMRLPATLSGSIAHRPGRAEYQRGSVTASKDGFVVAHTGDQSSNRLSSFSSANCLIEIPKHCGNLATGDQVQVLPLEFLIP